MKPAGAFAAIVLACLAALFADLARGRVLSPADALFERYPWTHESPRTRASNPSRTDEAFYHQPLMITHFARLRAGDLPDFDPQVLAGVPAFFQGLDVGRAFSPFSLPFYLFAPDIAVTLYGPLRLLVAALGMWLYLRHLGLGPAAAAGGGLAFGLNGGFIVWLSAPMPTVAAVLPIILMFADRAAATARWRDGLLLGLSLGVALLGAYLPTILAVGAVTLARAAWTMTARGSAASLPVVAAGLALGAGLGAVALVPMLDTLLTSPARGRDMTLVGPAWINLATFAMPDLWGNPAKGTWWYPTTGHYPELVTYLGVATIVLAGAGLAARLRAASRDRLFWALAVVWSLLVMYGAPPAVWIGVLPGFGQMNPLRWNVVLAMAVAVLAAYGLEALARPPAPTGPGRTGRWTVGRWRIALGALVAAALLALVSVLALAELRDQMRALALQPLAWAEVRRFALVAAGALMLVALAAVWPGHPLVARLLVALLALDLVSAGYGFNPTLERDRLYPTTPAIEFLQAEAGGARIAPVGANDELVQGHVWSVFGLETVTGFDYHGSADYQALVARAAGLAPGPPRWDYVGLPRDATLNLAWLGMLGTRFIVSPPLDVSTRGAGYAPVGELTAGRVLRQRLPVEHDGLRRIDLLAATYGRASSGQLRLRLVDGSSGELVAEQQVDAATLRDNDWLRMEFEAQDRSGGRAYELEITAERGETGSSATFWSAARRHDSAPLDIDGRPADRELWFRTFSTQPARWPGARLVYAHDLNIYRNARERPRAWFVERTEQAAADRHLDRMDDPAFDAARVAVVDAVVALPTEPARVTFVDVTRSDTRRIAVDAPAGGFLVVSERLRPGWTATIDGRAATLARTNAVLIGVSVPAGAREVTLSYRRPWLRPALALSSFCLLGTAVALTLSTQSGRRRRSPSTDQRP